MIPPLKLIHAIGIAAVALTTTLNLLSEVNIPDEYKQGGFAIGCQAYTFNRFSVFEAIEKTAEAGARKVFEFAKKMGLRAVTTESTDAIDMIEQMVKEYDVMVGFHDHPRQANNPNYRMWDPYYILSVVKDRDKRIGSCADTGHWQTSGLNPVFCLRVLKGHIISSHLKDKTDFGPGHDVPYGQGVGDVKRVLDELKKQGFEGNISIEYEYNWDNSVPDVKKCIEFVHDYGK